MNTSNSGIWRKFIKHLLTIINLFFIIYLPATGEDFISVIPRQTHQSGYLAVAVLDDVTHQYLRNVSLWIKGQSERNSESYECTGFSLKPGNYEIHVGHTDYFGTDIYNIPIVVDSLTDLKIYLTKYLEPDSQAKGKKEPVYDISMHRLIDPVPGDFYGKVFDRRTDLPVSNAEIKIPDTKYIARSDIHGIFWGKDIQLKDTCLEWTITHDDYETLHIQTKGADSSYPIRIMGHLEARKPRASGDSAVGPKMARFAFTHLSGGGIIKVIGYDCRKGSSTEVNLEEGEAFGPYKFLRIIDDSTVEISYNNTVYVLPGKPGDIYADGGTVLIGRSDVCFIEKVIDGAARFCLRRID